MKITVKIFPAAVMPVVMAAFLAGGCSKPEQQLPNILWITSEDNGRFLGCYGDDFATTPNLDRLASEGFLYTHAYANAPVCAPARNTIITGVHACANGHEQMRSRYPRSETVRFYTEYLKEKGYYCTNNSKTDYNTSTVDVDEMWDECSNQAHYKNRAEGQPFFAIFNTTISHESSIHRSIPGEELRHSPEEVPLPPYHPDTPEMRHDWAQYYDKVEDMDTRVGELLAELEEAGLAENTIVFYYSDHGGVLGRSKRFLYESGTHVPFIVRIPEKYKHLYPAEDPGSRVDRLVSFVDLAPTLLSLVGTGAPEFMQGKAFLGKYRTEEPEVLYMFRDRMDERYDMSRSIVDGEFRYTRNYNPSRIWLQHLHYLWRAPSMRSWEEAFEAGKCDSIQSIWWNPKPVEELYDIRNDPHEVNNLAGDPAYAGKLTEMRKEYREYALSIRDAGFIPEAERNIRAGELPIYDYVRSAECPLEEIMDAALVATERDPANLDVLAGWLDHDDSAIRYWAMQGLLLLGEEALLLLPEIKEAAGDGSWNVRVVAAEALYLLGETQAAADAYREVLQCDHVMARTHALNSIDHVDALAETFLEDCAGIVRHNYDSKAEGSQYDSRMIKWLFEKWDADPAAYSIEFTW
ncbi:MAG: sulfatase [Bacteroidales bacterium]